MDIPVRLLFNTAVVARMAFIEVQGDDDGPIGENFLESTEGVVDDVHAAL